MPSSATVMLVLLAAAALPNPVQGTSMSSNPIRKVVSMLQDMQKTVEAEGSKEAELFDKFMCYCSGGEGALDSAISEGKTQIEVLTSSIENGVAQESQLTQDLASHKADRAEAEQSMTESTALRTKEASAYAASSGDMKSNIDAMTNAIDALKKGLSAALLQTGIGSVLRNIVATSPAVRPNERNFLMSFLESGSTAGGATDTIIGVVEQMKDTMAADLSDASKNEADAKSAYETLMTAKKTEIEGLGKAIESKSARLGAVAVAVSQGKADLEKTTEDVAGDIDFRMNLKKSCSTKQQEWDERQKIRSEEVAAISETIEMLNSDDALELFKKALPATSALIQTSAATRSQMRRVRSVIEQAMMGDKKHSVNRRLILAALKSGTGGFEKVNTMIDGMNEVLEGEQVDDDKQDAWCLSELDTAKEEAKATEQDVGDVMAAIDSQRASIATTAAEIEALKKGLEELDKSVAEATEQRKDEHAEYVDDAASDHAAVELLGMAHNRLNKFYNPTLHTNTTSEPELENEFFAQINMRRAEPGPPPETFSGEYKKSGTSAGIINMIDEMTKQMKDDMAAAKRDEEEAQKDYEETMNDAATKRSDDSKVMVAKEDEKAEKTTRLEDFKETRRIKKGQLEVLMDKIDNLHKTCDFLIEQYAAIKEARVKEEDGLQTAKAVLAGASFGFLQH